MARLEMMLYHALDATGSIAISTTASTGPWTKITLTSTQCVEDALDEWQTLADVALPARAWTFYNALGLDLGDSGAVTFEATGGNAWVQLSAALAELLGFSATVLNVGDSGGNFAESDQTLQGVLMTSVGTTFPTDAEESEIADYRGARAAALHYGRAVEVVVDLIIAPDLWALVETSPILSGQAAFKVVVDNEAAFSESEFDGFLVVYPVEELERERLSDEDACWIRFRCLTHDPGATPAGPSDSTLWARSAGALPYGYGGYYIARREGIPTLFLEVLSDAIAPSNYDLDATLVIDRSARLGCLVDTDSPIAKGFDFELRLLDSPIVRTYLGTRPERSTFLTEAIVATDSGAVPVVVDDARAFAGLTEFYVGVSALGFNGSTDTDFQNPVRGRYGRARGYPIGTPVTDGPNVWQGAQVDLFFALVDPIGLYVQGEASGPKGPAVTVLSDAVMIWSGYVAERPVRDGTEWVMTVRDQVRRIADPLGAEASGTAIWTDEDDALVLVPTGMVYIVKADLQPTTNNILDVQIQPFSGYAVGDYARLSQLRTDIITALTAAATIANPGVASFVWVKQSIDATHNVWDLSVNFNPVATDTFFEVLTTFVSGAEGLFLAIQYSFITQTPLQNAVSSEIRKLGLIQPTRVTGAALAVVLDEGAAADLPTSGMVVLEGSGKVDYARYTALSIDATDASKVHLTLDDSERVSGEELTAILAGEREAVSVRFLWSDSGTLADILRRALASTGDAVHGAYDTLAKGHGLGLPMVDEASFATVFAGAFADLSFQIFADSGTSLAELFGGILRLSRTALVTRRNAAGTAVDVAAIDVGSPDTGVPAEVITEDMLVVSPGRRPVRVKSTFDVPQRIGVKVRSAPAGDVAAAEAAITFKDPHLVDWTGLKWDLEIYGLGREAVREIGYGWALSIFRSGETRQVLELDVPPWFDAQAGDVVELDLLDVSLWDYATGSPGYQGLARVLGDPISPTTAIKTITVACDGIYGAGPLAPSFGIVAVNGPAAAPTSIDIDEAYYDYLVAAKDGEASWRVLCYVPGVDAPGFEYWTISTVTLPGGGVARLTVTAYPASPAVSLDTTYLLTWPNSGDSTANQNRYVHTDDGRQWS